MLEIKNLTKKYGNKTVLDDFSLTLSKKGTVCGLVGLNGAGKSTLMKIICSLVLQNNGEIFFDGKNIKDLRRRKQLKLGFMIESPAFYESLTGRENLLLLAGLYDGLTKEDVDNAIAKVGMAQHAKTMFKKYSLGMKQRLYMAYAIINKPSLLILDEPFNGVDPICAKTIKSIIADAVKDGATVLLSSHGLSDIQSICDSVVVLDKGKKVFESKNVQEFSVEEKFFSVVQDTGEAQ